MKYIILPYIIKRAGPKNPKPTLHPVSYHIPTTGKTRVVDHTSATRSSVVDHTHQKLQTIYQ